ncbi:hypothetical protein EJ06DRAFT_253470 [Trichodelitschia bisporula]|uniref:Uncharacterized protein n=1 Tax=Trichodelitschia bisporula TaxID=703511 RepID=A0A6G1HJ32_9PEZI|nr:hypothetical protein EJ06DRAFT_253470 [Trichodelitschia bisporula]
MQFFGQQWSHTALVSASFSRCESGSRMLGRLRFRTSISFFHFAYCLRVMPIAFSAQHSQRSRSSANMRTPSRAASAVDQRPLSGLLEQNPKYRGLEHILSSVPGTPATFSSLYRCERLFDPPSLGQSPTLWITECSCFPELPTGASSMMPLDLWSAGPITARAVLRSGDSDVRVVCGYRAMSCRHR